MHYLRLVAVMVIFAIAYVENNIEPAARVHPEIHPVDLREYLYLHALERTKLER